MWKMMNLTRMRNTDDTYYIALGRYWAFISLMWGFAASTVGIGFTVGVCLHVVAALVVTIFGWDR